VKLGLATLPSYAALRSASKAGWVALLQDALLAAQHPTQRSDNHKSREKQTLVKNK